MAVSSVTAAPWPPNGWRLYGEEGTVLAEGFSSFTVSRLRGAESEREALPVPQRLLDELPQVGSDDENKWTALARDFVADVRGEPHRPYLMFVDGWRFQEAIEAIHGGRGWYELTTLWSQMTRDVWHNAGRPTDTAGTATVARVSGPTTGECRVGPRGALGGCDTTNQRSVPSPSCCDEGRAASRAGWHAQGGAASLTAAAPRTYSYIRYIGHGPPGPSSTARRDTAHDAARRALTDEAE
jgi:hypothetical protein